MAPFSGHKPEFEVNSVPSLDNISQYYLLSKDFAEAILFGKVGEKIARKYG